MLETPRLSLGVTDHVDDLRYGSLCIWSGERHSTAGITNAKGNHNLTKTIAALSLDAGLPRVQPRRPEWIRSGVGQEGMKDPDNQE